MLAAFLIYTANPGIFISDEATYTLMVKSLAVDGHFYIENGINEDRLITLLPPLSGLSVKGGEYRIYGQYPPLYTIIAAPFYMLLGLYGLHLLNIISYVCAIALGYGIFKLFFDRKKAAVLTFVYSLTYVLSYSQMIWPHMLSTMLVSASAYLFYRQEITGKNRVFSLFIAGFCSATAIGVRYPNGLYALLQLVYLFYADRRLLKYLVAGMFLPGLTLAALQYSFYGSVFEAGYYQDEYVNGVSFLYIIPIVGLAFLAYKTGIVKRRHLTLGNIALFLLLLTALGFCVDGIRVKLLEFFSGVFNMSYYPDKEGLRKKAILQSIPYLILAFFGPMFMKRRVELKLVALTVGYCLLIVIYTPFMPYSGFEESHAIRYVIDALPFMVLLAAFAVDALASDRKTQYLIVAGAVIAFIWIFSRTVEIFDPMSRLYSLAWGLYAGTAATAYSAIKGSQNAKKIFALLVAVSIAYSFSASLWSLKAMQVGRERTYEPGMKLAAIVDNNTVIIYPRTGNYQFLTYSKLYNRVRLLHSGLFEEELNESIDYYSAKGVNLYLCNCGSLEWFEGAQEHIRSKNLTDIRYIEYKIE